MSRSIVVLSVLMLTVSLAGCGPAETGNEPAEAKVLEVSAKGRSIEGTGYTLKAPKGWGARKLRIPGFGRADTHVFDLGDRDGFTDNFSVILAEPGSYDVDRMDAAALNEMGTIGARNRVVTFSFSPGLGRATREKTAEAVLNTWTWTP